MTPEPALPQWLVEAGEQFTDTWVPLTRMPGVPGPVKVSITGLLAGAYLAGWNDAQAQYGDGIPPGAKVLTAEQWNALRDVLWKTTGWRQEQPATELADANRGVAVTEFPEDPEDCEHGRWNPDNRQCLDCGHISAEDLPAAEEAR